MSRRVAPLFALALAGCQPGSAGTLLPIADPGVTIVTDHEAGDTAVIRRNGMEIRVSGFWTSMRGQSLDAAYSESPASAPVSLKAFASSRGHGPMALMEITDLTAVHPEKPDGASVNLYGTDGFGNAKNVQTGPPTISVAGRRLSASFENLDKPAELKEDDIVAAVVPVPGGPIRVRFRCD